VEIGDDDFGLLELLARVFGDEVELAVVVVGIVGEQDAEAVADGNAGGDDEERVGEAVVLRVGQLVEGVPGDEHGHDDGLAAAGGHFEGHAEEEWVGIVVGAAEVVFDPGVAVLAGDLGEVDGGFESLDLAEEEAALAGRVGPVGEEAAGDVGDVAMAALAPLADLGADAVDELVFLDAVLGPVGIDDKLFAALFGAGDGDEIGREAAFVDGFVGDALVGEVKVPRGLEVGGVEDGVFDDDLGHWNRNYSTWPIPGAIEEGRCRRQAARWITMPGAGWV